MTDVNPYESPQGSLLGEVADEEGEVRFFSASCRIGRIRYLSHGMLITLAFYALLAVGFIIFGAGLSDGESPGGFGTVALLLGAVLYIGFFYLVWVVMIQRLHDLDKSGFMSLLMLVPLVNLFMVLYLIFASGTDGPNQYGGRPPKNKTWNWILATIMPIFMLVGIIAAISLPAYQDYVERAKAAQSAD